MSGNLTVTVLKDGASAVNNLTFDANGNTTAGGTVAMASSFLRNRIINGAMVIDQRNGGASVTPTTGQYLVDRWVAYLSQASKFTAQQNAGSVTPPTGFKNYLGITSSSAYSVLSTDEFEVCQPIEGFNTADLAWGTAQAATVTLSFWVRSSLTGTFGGFIKNNAGNRGYVFSYSVSVANTWEQKSITIAGDTSGTWATDNTIGVFVGFSLGAGSSKTTTAGSWGTTVYVGATGQQNIVGTSGATFYITGVQLEVGTVATPFERRLYGQELALCQRYYYRITAQAAGDYFVPTGFAVSTTQAFGFSTFPVTMRTKPTALEQSGTATDYNVVRCGAGTNTNCSAVPTFGVANLNNAETVFTVASGLVNGGAGAIQSNNTNAYLGWSAEL